MIRFFIIFAAISALLTISISAQKSRIKSSPKDDVAAVSNQSQKPDGDKSATENSVLNEINEARTNPQKYIQYLEDYKKQFKGSTVFLPSLSQVQTNEGPAAVDEAIAFLKQISKLPPYTFSDGLNQAAGIQLRDLMENSTLGHRGKDGSDLSARMSKFGRFGTVNAENISYYAQDPRQIVMMMIVDDGVKLRSHRKNIFSPTLKVIGIAFGKGNVGQGLCVVDFADSFSDSKHKGLREF